MLELRDKKVIVLGLAKSGVAAAKLLLKHGAKVKISDSKSTGELQQEIAGLKNLEIETGGHNEGSLTDCELVVVSPGIPLDIPFLRKAQNLNIPIISEMELGYQYLQQNKVIAITGTNGKTTTTTLIGEILKTAGQKVVVAGNIGNPLSGIVDKIDKSHLVVVEISSFQLETIKDFRPNIAVFLNFTPDHLDRHKDLDNYLKTKARLFENQTSEDFMVLNANDSAIMEVSQQFKAKPVYFSSDKRDFKDGVWVEGNQIMSRFNGKENNICQSQDIILPGTHNLENALASIGVSLILNIELEAVRKTLKEFKGVEHRLEEIACINGVRFINDSKATNVDSVIVALKSFNEPIILIAGGRGKGCDYSRLNFLLAEKVKALILLGEAKDKIASQVNFNNIFKVQDLHEAVQLSYELAKPNNVVLLSPACASYDMFKNFEERGRVFKEAVGRRKSEL
ncbi:MAG: UDP-N-acetylmuramoyl-L-alanine--D-glutamate ligase [Nitrospirota bacterium]